MELYHIYAMGIRAYCSDMIIEPEELTTVCFMSIAGYQVAVKGIIANLLENYGISLDIEGKEFHLERSSLAYKVLVRKLPSGLAHAILFPKVALPRNDEDDQNIFHLFTDQEEERLGMFFRHLDKKTDIPLHPSWSGWLWKAFEDREWLIELMTLAGTYKGYSIRFNPKELHDMISDAMKMDMPEVTGCMRWKGGQNNGNHHFA